MLVLDPHGSGSLSLTGNAAITIGNGKAVVNSTAADAITLTGNAQLSASEIDVTGGYVLTGNAKISPKPVTGSKPIPDPLENLAAPSSSGLPVYKSVFIHGNTHLSPGVYASTLSVSAQSHVVLNPGIYILEQGISVAGGGSISGSGVLLYIAGGSIQFTGGSSGSLAPATSGPYAGVTVFQARANNSGAQMSGNTTWAFHGTFYFPSAQVSMTGTSNASQAMSLIVDRFSLTGNAGY